MAVTHNPAGFTGTVDQIDEARRLALAGGGRFRVASSADWAVTANSGATRTVNIAAGSGAACGVLDDTTAAETLTFAANAGGSDRFDAIVATFDWAAMTITFRVIQGTTVPPVVVRTGTTVDATKINWLPGLRYDAVLGIIRARPGVTTLAPADLYDLRPWGSWSTLNVASSTYRDVIDLDADGEIRDVSTGWTWQRSASGVWSLSSVGTGTPPNVHAMNGSYTVSGSGLVGITGYTTVNDDSRGLITLDANGIFTFQATGRVSITAVLTADSATAHWIRLICNLPARAAGSGPVITWEDFRVAPAGASLFGRTSQTLSGTLAVAAGNTCSLTADASIACGGAAHLLASYV